MHCTSELPSNALAQEEVLAKVRQQEQARREEQGEAFLYDIGRGKTTQFDPKSSKDSFFKPRENFKEDANMRLGPYRPSSRVIGEAAWSAQYSRPAKGSVSATRNFRDSSHLQVEGF